MVSNQKLKWKSDFDKGVLIQNFERRGWQRTTEGKGRFLSDYFLQTTGISTGQTLGPSSRSLTLKQAIVSARLSKFFITFIT